MNCIAMVKKGFAFMFSLGDIKTGLGEEDSFYFRETYFLMKLLIFEVNSKIQNPVPPRVFFLHPI